MKVVMHTNLPSPYRVDFFNSLSEYCDLTVIFERHTATNRNSKWYGNKEKKFNEKFLKGILYGEDNVFTLGLYPKLASKKYDVRVISGYSSLTSMITIFFLKLFKKKYVLQVDGAIGHKSSKIREKLKAFLIKGASLYLSTSAVTDDYLISYGADVKKIVRYHFTSLFDRDLQKSVITDKERKEYKEKLGIKEEKAFIAVGNYIHRKGFDLLLKASKDLPKDVGVYIVGGEPTQEYIDLKNSLNLENVHFVEHLSKEDLKLYYKASDLCVFPTRYDIWGLIVVEALGYGLPIITTDQCVAGLELVKDGYNGYIIPANDSDALNKKMLEVLSSNWLTETTYKNVLESIKDYTIENMAKEYYEAFSNLIKK
ncbi:MAG: glycosyltransferase family 4 protein [Clostridia bacterium]|nr:glycosyltransferase family 4 protein [Clostridia bacterium]